MKGKNFKEVGSNRETKGHRIRPRSMVPSEEYRDGWDRIFKKKLKDIGPAKELDFNE